jgi:hypothetical protein
VERACTGVRTQIAAVYPMLTNYSPGCRSRDEPFDVLMETHTMNLARSRMHGSQCAYWENRACYATAQAYFATTISTLFRAVFTLLTP